MAVTAVVNQKGGVGKTTVVLGLAAAAAARGRRVLVVDMDPQANATTGLGVWSAERTTATVLESEEAGTLASAVTASGWPAEALRTVPRVVPSSPVLAQREHQMATDVIGAQDRLALAMEGLDGFDDVLVDCPPSLGLLTVNALFAADRVLIVAEPAAWSSDGVAQILRNVSRIADRRDGRPSVAGILVNRLARTRDAAYWHAQLREAHPDLVLDPPVRLRAAVAEAAAQSVPIHALNRDGAAEAAAELDALSRALDPDPVADEVLDISGTGHPGAGTPGGDTHLADGASVDGPFRAGGGLGESIGGSADRVDPAALAAPAMATSRWVH